MGRHRGSNKMGMESSKGRTEQSVGRLQREHSRKVSFCFAGAFVLPPSERRGQNPASEGLHFSYRLIMPMVKRVRAMGSFFDWGLNARHFVQKPVMSLMVNNLWGITGLTFGLNHR